jgi:hypothetical protein
MWTIIISALVGFAAGGIITGLVLTHTKNQLLKKVKEWLIFAVSDADKYLEGEAGALKLRAVYDEFLSKFPSLVKWVSFDTFSNLVDDALDTYKGIISK